jgi:hypothetical protein
MEKARKLKNSRGQIFRWLFVEDIPGVKEMILIPAVRGVQAVLTLEAESLEEAESLARENAERWEGR